MSVRLPRLVIAGLSGDSGKTTVSLAILSALRERGLTVSVFKKGPDYIDAAWLGAVGEAICRNLDTYMVEPNIVRDRFISTAVGSDFALIEGNRGIFDGKDVEGSHTTAGLAKLIRAPVVLVVDATKSTRTLAAVVSGCISFEPELTIAGVILNKVAGDRHRKIITASIEKYCKIPVLGAVPKLGDDASIIRGRHLGLVTPREFAGRVELNRKLRGIAESFIDIDSIIDIANGAGMLDTESEKPMAEAAKRVRIGFFEDSVFTFYYPENLEALQRCGADLIGISSLDDDALPEIDALYIGGGFPETQARKLSANRSMLQSVKTAADNGLPIYAECGGLIYLSSSLEWQGKAHSMAGVFPVDLTMHTKPVGHGYTLSEIDSPNPFFEVGTILKGHEFHYSGPANTVRDLKSCMKMQVGVGVGEGRDALVHKSTFACYTHIHADGVAGWAEAMVKAAHEYHEVEKGKNAAESESAEGSGEESPGIENYDSVGYGWQNARVKYVANRGIII
jgi:cobyrinic acid a,c-diamide synthase